MEGFGCFAAMEAPVGVCVVCINFGYAMKMIVTLQQCQTSSLFIVISRISRIDDFVPVKPINNKNRNLQVFLNLSDGI
jgi:hypothetical protein